MRAATAASLWAALRTLWAERRCAACHAPFLPQHDDDMACAECAATLRPFTDAACTLCGMPFADAQAPGVPCGACLEQPPPWERLYFHGLYGGLLRSLILRFKFGQEFALLPLLGGMLSAAIATEGNYEAVLPIPRHPERLRARGFNQTHELARWIAQRQGIPLRAELLQRTRDTSPQIHLSAAMRRHNPLGSFAAADVYGVRVLLVDDIMTTGGTLRHAAQTLLDAGALSITVVVLARTPPPGT